MIPGTLFVNGAIYPLDTEGHRCGAMLVRRDGTIAELYPEGAPTPPADRTVDLGGRSVVPAFVDSHTHFMSKAVISAVAAQLSRLEGDRIVPDALEGVLELLRDKARASPRGPVLGFGLCIGAVRERRMPTARELDAACPGRVVVVVSLDGHSSSYSTPALRALGLEAAHPDGLLSGEAHEFNMGPVNALVLKGVGPRELAGGLSSAIGEAFASGVGTVHALEGAEGGRDLPVTVLSILGPRLPLRLRLWLQYTRLEDAARYARKLSRLRVGGCMAWEMDGSVSSRTAAFDTDYLDGGRGTAYRTPEQALELAAPFVRAGWQTAAHALGPRGIESILSAYESLVGEDGTLRGNRLRLRIEHFEFPRSDQIERAGRLGLVLAVQPGFAWADERFLGTYAEALPEKVRTGQCPLRSLLDAGCVLALSTDAPVQPLDPFVQIAGAVSHPVHGQGLTVFEALRAYTWAGAYASHDEATFGTLEPGKRADFTALDADPFATPSGSLHRVKATGTWLGGEPAAAPPAGVPGFALSCLRRKASPI